MAKSRQTKATALADLQDKLARMKSVVFSGYAGLTVKDVTELRRSLRSEDVELVMTKKTLLRQALPGLNIDASVVDGLEGEVALAFGFADEVTPAKLLAKFGKTKDALKMKGAVVNGQFLNATQAIALAKLPGRQELLTTTAPFIFKASFVFPNLARSLAGVTSSANPKAKATSPSRPSTTEASILSPGNACRRRVFLVMTNSTSSLRNERRNSVTSFTVNPA
jgi:large subunit ribosomal protein L10